MKTRNSLVSNSSSSSFILIGIPIEINQLTEQHINPLKSELITVIFGKYLCEGKDIFTLNDEKQLKFILDYPHFFKRAFISCKYLYEAEAGLQLSELKKLNVDLDKMMIIGGIADQNSSYSIETLLTHYESEIEAEIKVTAIQTLKQKYGVKSKC